MLKPVKLSNYTDAERASWPSNEERDVAWKLSPYSAHVWKILGRNGQVEYINFSVPTADATFLTDHVSLYRTTKEFAFWIRQHPESGTNGANTHKRAVTDIINFSCALTYRRIRTYSEIDLPLYNELMERWEYGTEGLLTGSDLIRRYLTQFQKIEDFPDGFVVGKNAHRSLARKKILNACGLPWASTPQVRWEIDECAQRVGGLRISAGHTAERPPLMKTGAATLGSRKAHFRKLYEYAPFIRAETIGFRPQTLGVGKRTRGGLKRPKRTKVVPPTLMFKLMAYAADLVALQIEEVVTIVDCHYRKLEVTPPPIALSTTEAANAIRRFSMAVYLLIAVFTARRPLEVSLLRRDCLAGSDEEGWSLNIFIVKNLNDWVWIPIPSIVASAIKGLLRLLPDRASNEKLFGIPGIVQARPVNLHPVEQLPILAADADAVTYQGRNGRKAEWDWIPRQTRRFSAALFYWRYEGPAEVVQHILRHVNIGDTRPYIENDAELATIWDEEASHFARRLAETIADGSEQLSGPMGNRLMRIRELIKHQLRKNLVIVDPERIADGLEEIFRRGLFVLIPKRWVICSCPATAEAAAKAMCRKQEGQSTDRMIGPDFQRAGPGPCASCYWGIQTSRTREFVAREVKELTIAASTSYRRGTVFGAIEEKNLARLVQVERKGATSSERAPREGIPS